MTRYVVATTRRLPSAALSRLARVGFVYLVVVWRPVCPAGAATGSKPTRSSPRPCRSCAAALGSEPDLFGAVTMSRCPVDVVLGEGVLDCLSRKIARNECAGQLAVLHQHDGADGDGELVVAGPALPQTPAGAGLRPCGRSRPPCGQRRSRRYARHASSVAKRCRAARPVRWVSRTPRRRPSAEAVRPR